MTQKKYLKESIKVGDKDLIVESGKVAKQADGSVVVTYGDTDAVSCGGQFSHTPAKEWTFSP